MMISDSGLLFWATLYIDFTQSDARSILFTSIFDTFP